MKYYIFEINASLNPDIKEIFAFDEETSEVDIANAFYDWEREVVIGNNSNGFRLATMEEAYKYGRNKVDTGVNAVFACED